MDKRTIKFYHEKEIFYARLELIKGFLFHLLDIIDRTYFGDYIMTTKNKKEHFDYSLNRAIEQYSNQLNIQLNNSTTFSEMLFNLFFKNYYDNKKTRNSIDEFKFKITSLFNHTDNKEVYQLEEINRYYTIFHKNIGDYLIF